MGVVESKNYLLESFPIYLSLTVILETALFMAVIYALLGAFTPKQKRLFKPCVTFSPLFMSMHPLCDLVPASSHTINEFCFSSLFFV